MSFLFSVLMTLAFAQDLQPTNPEILCDRLINPSEKESCLGQAKKLDLDWYAASICGQMDEDQNFLGCWKKINGKNFDLKALGGCAGPEMSDEARSKCLQEKGTASSSGRLPASFQDTKTKSKKKR